MHLAAQRTLMFASGFASPWKKDPLPLVKMDPKKFTIFPLLILGCQLLLADDWPQWRGPERDGVWRESGILRKFPPGGPRVVWRKPIGGGYSGPAVVGNRLYAMDRSAKDETETVLCLDAEKGDRIWEHTYAARYRGVDYGAGPRATPTVHDGRVYTLGTMGNLFCLGAARGEVLWEKDLKKAYNVKPLIWGLTAAPLIEKNLVIVSCGGKPSACVIALDWKTGEEVWKAVDDVVGYAPPVLIEAGGKRQLIQWTARNVISLDPTSGKEYWRLPFPSSSDLSVMTPVHHGGYLFVSAFFNGSLLMDLDSDKPGAKVHWRSEPSSEHDTRIIHCLMSTPQFRGDHFYGVDSYGALRGIEISTGKRLWETLEPTRKARWSNAHLTPNGDATFIWNEHGELVVARLTPGGYSELGRARLLDPTEGTKGSRAVTWAHPAYSGKRVFVRNDEEILCASLAAP